MAQLNKIKSFKSFSEVMAQDKAVKVAEENAAKRGELTSKIAALLDEMNITSFDDLDEEVKREFIAKAFGNVSEEEAGIEAEELEDETKVVDTDVEQPEDVEKDLDLEGEGDAEGDELAEGNAFIYAAAKARAEGKSEFEFNGKKYKVTLKADTGLKESVLIITEGTRGQFGKIYKSGEIASVYTHYDSYPENMLPTIKKGYKKGTDVDAVLGKGDNSGLEVSPDKMNFYGDPNSMNPMKGSVKNLKKYINDADAQGAEYIYLFDERDKKWYMVDVYGDRELVPAFESLVSEATVEMDAMNPGDKDFLKFLKKHNVKIIKTVKGSNGFPEIVMQGSRKDLQTVLADGEYGWDDADLAEYIEEGNAFGDAVRKAKEAGEKEFEFEGETYKVEEGNAFGDAVRKAKEAGEKEFEFEGETYKVEESTEVNEGEVDIYPEVEGEFMQLYSKLNDLAEDTTDTKWRKAIEGIIKGLEGVENKIGQTASKLGVVPTHESAEVNENYEVIYSDGVSAMKKFRTEQQALDFMKQTIDSNKKLRDIAVYKPGMHSTAQTELVIAFWGNGSYLDNVSKKDPKLAAKKLEESVEVNEAEIKSDEEFKEYAVSVLQKAFGDDYDEAKAMEVVDGILGKVDGDYGAAVGMLTSSLGESVEVNESCGECGQNPCECDSVEEKKADGTISDDEDEKREELLGEVEQVMDTLLKRIKEVSFEIGGNFRAPGIQHDAKKVIDTMVKKFK